MLAISLRMFDEMLATGRLRSLTIGRRRLIDLRDIVAFIESAKEASEP